jgi:hypothetical protein
MGEIKKEKEVIKKEKTLIGYRLIRRLFDFSLRNSGGFIGRRLLGYFGGSGEQCSEQAATQEGVSEKFP